jgi:hypothetical protein
MRIIRSAWKDRQDFDHAHASSLGGVLLQTVKSDSAYATFCQVDTMIMPLATLRNRNERNLDDSVINY